MAHDKAYTFVAALLRRSKNRTATNLDHYAKRSKRYMIERDIPGIGAMSATELGGAAKASTKAIEQIGSYVQWQHSYVAADKTYCVYLAKDEAAIHRHAKLSGIPRPILRL